MAPSPPFRGFPPSSSILSSPCPAINANQLASPYSLITQRQFRIAVGGIYNIIQYNSVTGAATLDRPFGDPSGVALSFQLYQLYYTPPMLDFLTWVSITNPTMFYDLQLNLTRAELDRRDPQRTTYLFPTHAVPFSADLRGLGTPYASPTLYYPMYELWGSPVTVFTYQCYGLRRGTDLVLPTDTLPPAVAEETVMALARAYAYEWAEANKDIAPRNTGPDFRFLIERTMKEYQKLLVRDRVKDREFVDNFFVARNIVPSDGYRGFYNTIAGVASTVTGGYG